MIYIRLPDWIKLLLSQTKHNGMKLHFSKRLKALIYKVYIEYLGQALYSELLKSTLSK